MLTIPPALNPAHVANFHTLQEAEDNGDLALVSAIRKADKKPVALVCAMHHGYDDKITPVPIAEMIDGDPFELYEDPTV